MSLASHTHNTATCHGRITVGVADIAVVNEPGSGIVTHALGSCIGVTVYDPAVKVAGMLHFMLPTAKGNENKAKENPYMYCDTGVPLLFHKCYELGAKKDRLIVCAAGGAEIMNDGGKFRIGARNRTSLRQIFWKNNILLAADETGGNISRTMYIECDTGTVTIRHKNQETVLWSA